jgi:hypothetical protein
MTSETVNLQNNERLLYNRKKNVDIFMLSSGRRYRVVAELQDAVHHMRINMIVNHPSLRIKEIECEMPGVPDPLCQKAQNCLKPMIGKQVAPGLTRGMSQMAREGCTHLINLFHDACYNVLQAQGVIGKEELGGAFPGITEEQIYKIWFWFKPEIQNSCIRYVDGSPFMQNVKTVTLPKGAEKLKAIAQKK